MKKGLFVMCLMCCVVLFGCLEQPTLNGVTFGKITIAGDDDNIVAQAIREQLLLKGASFDEQKGLHLEGNAVWVAAILKYKDRSPRSRRILRNLIVSVTTVGEGRKFSALVQGKDHYEDTFILMGYADKVIFSGVCAKHIAKTFANQARAGNGESSQ